MIVACCREGSELAAFAGADKSTYTRTAPVEFEKVGSSREKAQCLSLSFQTRSASNSPDPSAIWAQDVADPFGLDTLLSEARKK